jgi:hypothetical protein
MEIENFRVCLKRRLKKGKTPVFQRPLWSYTKVAHRKNPSVATRSNGGRSG